MTDMEFSVDNNFNTGSQVVPAMPATSSGLEAVLTMLLGGDNTILHQPTLSTDILITPSLVTDSTASELVPSFNTTPPSSVTRCGHHRPEQSLICNLHKPHIIPQFPTFMFRPAPPILTMSPFYPTSSMMFTPTSQIQKGRHNCTDQHIKPIHLSHTNQSQEAGTGRYNKDIHPSSSPQEDLNVT